MNSYPITIKPFGQQAILIEWPNKVDEGILNTILNFKSVLKSKLSTSYELVPAYNSLTIVTRTESLDFPNLKEELQNWYQSLDNAPNVDRYLYKFPVCYDLEFGIDLKEVSMKLGMSVQEIIKNHSSHQYTVYGIGFLPGFMYLGGLPKNLELPRRSNPRLKVVKGSVGLAAKQTGIYPQDSPGGWNIIGNCPIPIFNSKAVDPFIVNVGDRVQFVPISKDAYKLHKIEGEVGIFSPEKTLLHD